MPGGQSMAVGKAGLPPALLTKWNTPFDHYTVKLKKEYLPLESYPNHLTEEKCHKIHALYNDAAQETAELERVVSARIAMLKRKRARSVAVPAVVTTTTAVGWESVIAPSMHQPAAGSLAAGATANSSSKGSTAHSFGKGKDKKHSSKESSSGGGGGGSSTSSSSKSSSSKRDRDRDRDSIGIKVDQGSSRKIKKSRLNSGGGSGGVGGSGGGGGSVGLSSVEVASAALATAAVPPTMIPKKKIKKKDDKSSSSQRWPIWASRTPKQGDQVAAKLESEENWILATVVKVLSSQNMFLVVDDDGGEGKHRQFKVKRNDILTFPREGEVSGAVFPAKTKVMALYPGTTTFYPATISAPFIEGRNGETDMCVMQFQDDDLTPDGKIPDLTLPARFVRQRAT